VLSVLTLHPLVQEVQEASRLASSLYTSGSLLGRSASSGWSTSHPSITGSVSDPDPDWVNQSGPLIWIQEGKNDLQKMENAKLFHGLKCLMFSFEV
jgi:hypothetical protein